MTSQDLASRYQVAGIQVFKLVFFLHLHAAFSGTLPSPGGAEKLQIQAESHSLWLEEPENRVQTCQSSYKLRGEILKSHRGRALKSASENPQPLAELQR